LPISRDYDFENVFTGRGIALKADGTLFAIAGSNYMDEQDVAVVRALKMDTANAWNYTLS
jgi:hypothetical protein